MLWLRRVSEHALGARHTVDNNITRVACLLGFARLCQGEDGRRATPSDAKRRATPSAEQRWATPSAGQRRAPENAGQRQAPGNAERHRATTSAGQCRAKPGKAGQRRASPGNAGQRRATPGNAGQRRAPGNAKHLPSFARPGFAQSCSALLGCSARRIFVRPRHRRNRFLHSLAWKAVGKSSEVVLGILPRLYSLRRLRVCRKPYMLNPKA